MHLRGQGKGATVLTIDQMPTTRRPLLFLSGDNWSISDLTVDCADFYSPIDERYAALGGASGGVAIRDVEIRRMGRIGILIADSNNFRIENCEIALTTPTNDLNSGILIPKTESPIRGGISEATELLTRLSRLAGIAIGLLETYAVDGSLAQPYSPLGVHAGCGLKATI